MNTTWRSLLCQGGWQYPTTAGNWFTFNEDYTGELHCGVAPAAFICAEFTWRTVGDSATSILQQTVNPENSEGDHGHASIDIEITLHERKPSRRSRAIETTFPHINVQNLTSAAFQPKEYRLQVAKGAFTPDKWLCFKNSSDLGEKEDAAGIEPSYDFQIIFDRSPYPPLGEWVEQKDSVDRAIRMHRFWEFRDFYK